MKDSITAHVLFNTIDMVYRGKTPYISTLEKVLYAKDINVRWQPKVWVDIKVMVDIEINFVWFKKEKHGDDIVLLIFNNVDAQFFVDVLEIFGSANILVWVCISAPTDLI